MSADIIELSKIINGKEEDEREEAYYENHNYILDKCEEVFYNAIILEVSESGHVSVSATEMDKEDIIASLISAALFLQKQKDDEDE
jgi:hypothetical protein